MEKGGEMRKGEGEKWRGEEKNRRNRYLKRRWKRSG